MEKGWREISLRDGAGELLGLSFRMSAMTLAADMINISKSEDEAYVIA